MFCLMLCRSAVASDLNALGSKAHKLIERPFVHGSITFVKYCLGGREASLLCEISI